VPRLHTLDLFVWSRLAIWLAVLGAPLLVEGLADEVSRRPDVIERTHELGTATDVWARWDGYWFVSIAEDGYGVRDGAAAFYPLYPGLLAVVGRLLGGHYVLAGVIVSLAATLVVFELLYRLARERLGDDRPARLSVLLLAVFPTSLFLQAVYSEALFLMLCLAAFLLAERRHLVWCGVAAGLALLTRPLGVALLPALAVLVWRAPGPTRQVAWLAIAPALFSLYPLVLWHGTGDPLAFAHVEDLWDRSLDGLGPLGGLWDAMRAAWAGVLQLTVGSDTNWYWSPVDPAGIAARNLEATAYLALFAGLTIVAWRRLGAAYGVFCVASLAIPLATPTRAQPLLSLPRFSLVLFPAFIALAAVLEGRPRLALAVVGVSSVLLGVSAVRWGLWQFVA
jgi:hypothetical protein